MNVKVLVALVVALLAVQAVAGDVTALTSETFGSFVQENEYVLVEFYAPWCGHCKALAPKYEEAAEILAEDGVVLAKVDATEEEALAQQLGVKGFPTLFWFRNGRPSKYSGGREVDEIVEWCLGHTGAPYKVLESEAALAQFREEHTVNVVGWLPGFEEGAEVDGATELVAVMGSDGLDGVAFGIVADEALFGLRGDAAHNVEAMHPEHGVVGLHMGTDEESVVVAARKLLFATAPVFASLPSMFDRVQAADVPIVVAFVDPAQHAEEYEKMQGWAKQYASEMLGRLPFTQVGTDFFDRIEMLGGSAEDIPTLIITDLRRNWVFDKSNGLTDEAVAAFVAGFLDGSLKAHFKSDPVPAEGEELDEGVAIVVGETFESIVLDPSKDVLLEFYAPWCGHCKALAPVYAELAAEFEDDDDVVVAKMDATSNDHTADVEVKGFPTIVLFPKGNAAPVVFEGGDRSLASLSAFVRENRAAAETHDEL